LKRESSVSEDSGVDLHLDESEAGSAGLERAERSKMGTRQGSWWSQSSLSGELSMDEHGSSKASSPGLRAASPARCTLQRKAEAFQRPNFPSRRCDGSVSEGPVVGIIGLGDMGSMLARTFAQAGYSVLGCDLPERFEALHADFADFDQVEVLRDATSVARTADIQIYAVETSSIEDVARSCGLATKVSACVIGLCNVKDPEIRAFDRWLPKDVSIVPIHNMHGPNVGSHGQTMVMIPHRCSPKTAAQIRKIFEETFGYIVEEMTVEDHDAISADTVVLSNLGLLAMGNAWCKIGESPWEYTARVGGLDHVKVLTCLRSYALKAHSFCGVAMLNPRALQQVQAYSESVSELFKLMIRGEEKEFTARIMSAKQSLFDSRPKGKTLLPAGLLEEFLPCERDEDWPTEIARRPSSHLDILAAVDAWHRSGISPFRNLVCETPVFRLRLGMAEYLFCHPELLQKSIQAALYNHATRLLDFEFVLSVKEWATIIAHGDVDAYTQHFLDCKEFFRQHISKASAESARLIERLAAWRERSITEVSMGLT